LRQPRNLIPKRATPAKRSRPELTQAGSNLRSVDVY
jgi:hypothetical protein